MNTRAAWSRSIQSFNSYSQSIYRVVKSLAKVLCAQGAQFREAQFKTKQFREAQTSLQSFSLSTSLEPMSCRGIEPGFLWPINLQIHLAYRSSEVLGSILVWGGKVFGTLHSIQCYNSYIQSINTQLFKSKCPSTPIALNIGGDGHFGLVRGESLGGGSKGGGAKFFLVISFEIH